MTGANLIASGRVPKMERILFRTALSDFFWSGSNGVSPSRPFAHQRRPDRPQVVLSLRSLLSEDRSVKVPKAGGPHQREEIEQAHQAEPEAVTMEWWARLPSGTPDSLAASMASSMRQLTITR